MKIFLLLTVLLGCAHRHQPHGGNSANIHMHQHDHKQLIHSFDDPVRDKWQNPKLVMEQIGDIAGLKVIDIGSGSGYFTKYFLHAGALVTAADVDDQFLKHININFPQIKFQKLKLSKIAFDDPKMGKNEYDVAFTSNTYHHIDGRVTYLKKIKEGLKPNGKLIIVDFKANSSSTHTFGPPLKMRVPLEIVIKELIEAGFSRIDINNQDLEYQYLVMAR